VENYWWKLLLQAAKGNKSVCSFGPQVGREKEPDDIPDPHLDALLLEIKYYLKLNRFGRRVAKCEPQPLACHFVPLAEQGQRRHGCLVFPYPKVFHGNQLSVATSTTATTIRAASSAWITPWTTFEAS
jgi:hypothetical protein